MGADLLVIGRSGQLAQCLAERAGAYGLTLETAARPELDLAHRQSIEDAVLASAAPVIINTAAYTAVDQAESEPEAARQVNAVAPGVLAEAAGRRGARLVHISTDYVFDGRADVPYSEEEETGPLGVYGATKLAGEKAVRAAAGDHVIVRTAWVYSPFGRNFVKTMLALAETRDELRVVDDQLGTPTSAFDLADGLLKMVKTWQAEPERGIGTTYHFAGVGETSWAGLATEVFELSRHIGGPSARVIPISTQEWPTPAARPRNSRLCTERFARTFSHHPPNWRESLRTVVERLIMGSGSH